MNSAIDPGRRRLLRGQWLPSQSQSVFRPPWAEREAVFTELCSRCDDCIGVCPEKLLVRGSGGFPEADFRRGRCSFCGLCVQACKTGALRPLGETRGWAWTHRPSFGSGCLAVQGTVCRTCGDVCDSGAIAFRLARGGRSYPELDQSRCNGCGACVGLCPVGAVSLQQL